MDHHIRMVSPAHGVKPGGIGNVCFREIRRNHFEFTKFRAKGASKHPLAAGQKNFHSLFPVGARSPLSPLRRLFRYVSHLVREQGLRWRLGSGKCFTVPIGVATPQRKERLHPWWTVSGRKSAMPHLVRDHSSEWSPHLPGGRVQCIYSGNGRCRLSRQSHVRGPGRSIVATGFPALIQLRTIGQTSESLCGCPQRRQKRCPRRR